MKGKVVCILCILCAFYGCTIVGSKAPVGETPAVVKAKEWDGTWFNPGGDYCRIKVKSENDGILRIAWIEEGKELTYKSSDIFIRSSGSWLFASMKDEEDKTVPDGMYMWAIIKKEKEIILIWLPQKDRFKTLIEEKKLPGEVKKDLVLLGDLKPEHMKIIASEGRSLLFNWEEPLVLIKLNN